MKNVAEIILGLIVLVLGVVCVWEFTIISSLKKEVKAKGLMIDAQAVRARDLQEQIVEKDQTIQLLTIPAKSGGRFVAVPPQGAQQPAATPSAPAATPSAPAATPAAPAAAPTQGAGTPMK